MYTFRPPQAYHLYGRCKVLNCRMSRSPKYMSRQSLTAESGMGIYVHFYIYTHTNTFTYIYIHICTHIGDCCGYLGGLGAVTRYTGRAVVRTEDDLRCPELHFRVWGLGFRVWGLGFRV